MNGLKTALLLGLLSGLLIVGGRAIGGPNGMLYGLLFAVAMNFFSYFFSEKMALAASGAIPVTESENPQVYRRIAPMVKRIADRNRIPMPRLWVTPEPSPNAFATGRNPSHSSVAVTAGLLELMDDDELEGVLAHELGHVTNRDILISSVAATLAAAITYLAHFAMFFGGRRSDDDDGPNPLTGILMIFLAPLAASLIQMAISRSREFAADESAARAMGTARPLASALAKLDSWSHRIPMDAQPAMAHMFIMKPANLMRLFSTHPPTEERIARLRSLQL
jgi:heat shock protein HtpX